MTSVFRSLPALAASLLALAAGAGACADSRPVPAPLGQRLQPIGISNALSTNRMTGNRMTGNALAANRMTGNALSLASLQNVPELHDALVDPTPTPDGLTYGAWAREVLAYAYGCAMPAGQSMQLVIDGVDYGTLEGAIGLAPEWATGPCNLSCQRWISACLMSRTNFFGVPVAISIRGDHPALATDAAERAMFPVREGSYYGNVFDHTETDNKFTCFGPGSSSAELTDRLCSSPDANGASIDLCGILIQGSCEPAECTTEYYCDDVDPVNGASDCRDYLGNSYAEVITVYLKQPVPACGNGVCESGESTGTCAGDCWPGWAQRVSGELMTWSDLDLLPNGQTLHLGDFGPGTVEFASGDSVFSSTPDGLWLRLSPTGAHVESRYLGCDKVPLADASVGPDGVCVTGRIDGACDLGGAVLTGSKQRFLAKYTHAGAHLWSKTLSVNDDAAGVHAMPDGGCALVGNFRGTATFGGTSFAAGDVFGDAYAARFDAAGAPLWARHYPAADYTDADSAVTAAGDLYLAGSFSTSIDIGGVVVTGDSSSSYLARVGADGATVWAQSLPIGGGRTRALAADAAGVLITMTDGFAEHRIAVYDATGAEAWQQALKLNPYEAATLGAGGDPIIAVGSSFRWNGYDYGSGLYGGDQLVALARDTGELRWFRQFGSRYPASIHAVAYDAARAEVVLAGSYEQASNYSGTLLTLGTGGQAACFQQQSVHRFADPGAIERCNGVDDDGDGRVDEGLGNGTACDGADADRCTEGVVACGAAGFACDDDGGDAIEICGNLYDDDCDGLQEGEGDPCTPFDQLPDGGPMTSMPDAGADAGPGGDADAATGEQADAGGPGVDDGGGGCGCRAAGRERAGGAGLLLALLLLGYLRRPWRLSRDSK